MDTIIVAIVAGILGPVIMTTLTWIFKRSDRREEWKRQDEVANQVTKVQKDLKIQNEKVNEKFDINKMQLDRIHLLVNSTLTIAKQAEYDALVRELISLRELLSLKAETGNIPDPQTLQYIDEATKKITKLRQELDDRAEVQGEVDKI